MHGDCGALQGRMRLFKIRRGIDLREELGVLNHEDSRSWDGQMKEDLCAQKKWERKMHIRRVHEIILGHEDLLES